MKAYAQRLAAALPDRFVFVAHRDDSWRVSSTTKDGFAGRTLYSNSSIGSCAAFFADFLEEFNVTPADLDQSLPMLESLADAVCRKVEK